MAFSTYFPDASSVSTGDYGNYSLVRRNQYNTYYNYKQCTITNGSRKRIFTGTPEEEELYAEFHDYKLGDVMIIKDLGYILEWERDEDNDGWVMTCERNFSVGRVAGWHEPCSVVSYDGPGRAQALHEDFIRFTGILPRASIQTRNVVSQNYFRICDPTPNNVQVFGMNRSNTPQLLLHNNLPPLSHFLDRVTRGSSMPPIAGVVGRRKKYTVVSYGGSSSKKEDRWKEQFRRDCRDQTHKSLQRASMRLSFVSSLLSDEDPVPFAHFKDRICSLGQSCLAALEVLLCISLYTQSKLFPRCLWTNPRGGLFVTVNFGPSLPFSNFSLPTMADLVEDSALLRYILLTDTGSFVIQLWRGFACPGLESRASEPSDMISDRPTIISNEPNARFVVGTRTWEIQMCDSDYLQGITVLPDGRTREKLAGQHGRLTRLKSYPLGVQDGIKVMKSVALYMDETTGWEANPDASSRIISQARFSPPKWKLRRRQNYPTIYLFRKPNSARAFWSFDPDGQVAIPNHLRKSLGLPRIIHKEIQRKSLHPEYPITRTVLLPVISHHFTSEEEEDLSLDLLFNEDQMENKPSFVAPNLGHSALTSGLSAQNVDSKNFGTTQYTTDAMTVLRKARYIFTSMVLMVVAVVVLVVPRELTFLGHIQRLCSEFDWLFAVERWRGIAAWCRY